MLKTDAVAGYLMPEEVEQEEMEDDEDEEMDADFTPEMRNQLQGMITMGMYSLPTVVCAHFESY